MGPSGGCGEDAACGGTPPAAACPGTILPCSLMKRNRERELCWRFRNEVFETVSIASNLQEVMCWIQEEEMFPVLSSAAVLCREREKERAENWEALLTFIRG